jgi:SAM-dependent methyltransferase
MKHPFMKQDRPRRFSPQPSPPRSQQGGKGHTPPGGRAEPKRDLSRGGTSWEKSADWYDKIIGERGSELYQEVVIPGALDLLRPTKGEKMLDLGCGQGVFSRALAESGSLVTGIDASRSLVEKARRYAGRGRVRYYERDAADLAGLGDFDGISAILCLQNLEHLDQVCLAAAHVLRPGGRMLWVLNHPAFRIPRQSSWGYEEERKIQYRRMDAYSSTLSIPIVMHPGRAESETTVSIHRSLEELAKPALAAGLVMSGLREWHSHKQSQPGPRARAENRARQEFPLFLALLWAKPHCPASAQG